jgi:hypothetical protein
MRIHGPSSSLMPSREATRSQTAGGGAGSSLVDTISTAGTPTSSAIAAPSARSPDSLGGGALLDRGGG